MGKYYLGQQTGAQTNFSVVDATDVVADLNLSGQFFSVTGNLTSGNSLLQGNNAGRFNNVTIGSGLLLLSGTLHATGGGGGGGGGDADTLNGQPGAFYRDAANLTGTMFLELTGLESIQFDTGNTGAGATQVGELEWSPSLGTLEVGLLGGNLVHYVGQQIFERVKNNTTGTLNKGEAVFVSGAQGNRISVQKAIAISDLTSATTFGLVAESIAAGTEGFVISEGILQGLNTTGFAEGAILWLSPTISGRLTATKPVAPDHGVMVGFCVRSHATVGEILVKVKNGNELDEIHDVRITSPAEGQTLTYNSASGIWVNANLSSAPSVEFATTIALIGL